jgi:hypothetical protein
VRLGSWACLYRRWLIEILDYYPPHYRVPTSNPMVYIYTYGQEVVGVRRVCIGVGGGVGGCGWWEWEQGRRVGGYGNDVARAGRVAVAIEAGQVSVYLKGGQCGERVGIAGPGVTS